MDIEAEKQRRSKCKQSVTVAARRLISSCDRSSDIEILQNLMTELEKTFSDFIDIDSEYAELVSSDENAEHRIVNGESLSQYKDTVSKTYEDARAKFQEIKSLLQTKSTEESAEPVRSTLKRTIVKIYELFNRIDDNLSSSNPDINILSFDRDSLDSLLNTVNSQMEKLHTFISPDKLQNEQKETDEINDKWDRLKRHIHRVIGISNQTPESMPARDSPPITLSQATTVPFTTTGHTDWIQPHPWPPIHQSMHPVYLTREDHFPLETSTNSTHSPSPTVNYSTSMPVSYQQSAINQQYGSPNPFYSQAPNIPTHIPSHNHYPAYNTSTGYQHSYSKPFSQQTQSDIQIKKISLPTFSGKRQDWPEFKAVWRELAEKAFQSKTALAHELKRSVHGEASQRIKSVFATKPEAYDVMWHKLESYYDDTSASVQAALDSIQKLKMVREDDYKGLVELIDNVECAYSQLEQLEQLNTLTMRDVDQISNQLPSNLKFEWMRRYHDLTTMEKIKPFEQFMKFLEREREVISRLAEAQIKSRKEYSHSSRDRHVSRDRYQSTHQSNTQKSKKFYPCAFHQRDGIIHVTSQCKAFERLDHPAKIEKLKEMNACFICFGDHPKSKCPNRKPCETCQMSDHHQLICKKETTALPSKTIPKKATTEVDSNAATVSNLALYPIQQAKIAGTGKEATTFSDGGSNTTYITHKSAERIKAKKVGKFTLDVTTMGNVQTSYDTYQYEFYIQTQTGRRMKILAYGMDKITGKVSKLDLQVLQELFPDFDIDLLQRKSDDVDILLGCDYFGLHPKTEIARAGDNLSIMSGELGICLQGSHPRLKEETQLDCHLVKIIHETQQTAENSLSTHLLFSHPEFTSPNHNNRYNKKEVRDVQDKGLTISSTYETDSADLFHTKSEEKDINTFVMGEELCTNTTPRCGSCKCGKCPVVGHTYSFKEEQELRMIPDNLHYNPEKSCWVTSYPWIVDPSTLPDNYNTAYSTLLNTERTLSKDPDWATQYKSQIEDMVQRQVARKLTDYEIRTWNGPYFYISHLAVINPKSQSTPVRIVFNSSQLVKGISLNSCLAKGPDAYINNLIGLLLRWREESTSVVGDIKKMFNSVHLEPIEQHCHRFLWRDLQTQQKPDVYVIERVNMGDKPAPAISTEAIYKTAEMFHDDCPRAAELLRKSTYVDDLIDSFSSLTEAKQVTSEVEKMLNKGGFKIKCWQFSGESDSQIGQEQTKPDEVKTLLKGTKDNLRVLGIGWIANQDVMVFQTSINFSKKKKGQRTQPDLLQENVPKDIPNILTRRTVLEQVMVIYDPLGILSPFTLLAKVYLRDTWELKLGWDEPLPTSLRTKWVNFFQTMFEFKDLKYERCLHPAGAVGRPSLIIMSDGSNIAYGCAAYILWKLKNGNHWLRLVMAKCRIAPVNRLSTPQMELNAAVLSKRASLVLQKEMRFNFERILHLVDSETVLNMLNKTSTRFKVYEGVRIGEIQAASNGDMSNWAWIAGEVNTADWLTRGRTPKQLNADSEWWKGPSILYLPMEEWNLKYGLQQDVMLPGERKICTSTATFAKQPLIDYKRFSSINRIIWVLARVRNILKNKSFTSGHSSMVTPEDLRYAENLIVKDIQSTLVDELQKVSKKSGIGGCYSKLNPVKGPDGIWTIGNRMLKYSAMTADSELQKLLPTSHYGTRLFMRRAHEAGHLGRNATLAKFRQYFWTPHGDKLAKSIKHNCQLCKLREPKLLEQEMGLLPEARLKPSTPFNHVMLDLFGPYTIRGEVQKRTSGKAYGVIFTDLTMRAVHIEAVFGKINC